MKEIFSSSFVPSAKGMDKIMKKNLKQILLILLVIFLTSCSNQSTTASKNTESQSTTNIIVDMAGRKVNVPKTVKKVYSVNPIGTVMVYTLAPKKVLGWNYEFTENEKKYIIDECKNLPNLGSAMGNGNTSNMEEIIKQHPDVIIYMWDSSNASKQSAENLQKTLNIPVVVVDGALEKTAKAYEVIGKAIGEEKAAKELGDYCSKIISNIKAEVKKVPEDKMAKVYYATGMKGLQTEPKNSNHTEVFELIKANNVAGSNLSVGNATNASPTVSMEQVVNWNPEVIFVGYQQGHEGGPYKTITTDAGWKNIDAVKNQKVFSIPEYPFNWFDRPPSVNRILCLEWMANKLYPDYVKLDIKSETKKFYSKFYHYQLTDDDVNKLINRD